MIDARHKIEGVFAAAFTAFADDGAVDAARTARHACSLLDQGCDGIALLGTTGEANSLSLTERRFVLETAIEAGIPPHQLLPGTGVCSVPGTVELTRHARSLGVAAVLLLPPFYYPDPSEAGLVAHYSRVIDGVADGGLRVLLYHIPQNTGVPITPRLIAVLDQRFPGVIAGVKDSGGDLDRMHGLVTAFPHLAILAGADPLLAPLLRAGGAGCITATSNLIAPLLAELRDRVRAGQGSAETAELERRIAEARGLFQRWPQIPALKAAQAAITGERAWGNVRPPLLPLDERGRDALVSAMAAAGSMTRREGTS
jgi:4-hydroxy-tetrahydrodipicolinate synthase